MDLLRYLHGRATRNIAVLPLVQSTEGQVARTKCNDQHNLGTSRLQRPRRLQLITAQLCVWIFEPRQDWQSSHFPGSFGATIYDKIRCRLQWLSRPCVQYNENRDVKDLKYAIGFSICNIVFVLPWPQLQKKNACSIEAYSIWCNKRYGTISTKDSIQIIVHSIFGLRKTFCFSGQNME